MNKTIKLLLFLGIISGLSGIAIGSLNDVLEPIIEENDYKTLLVNINEIFPDSDFEILDYEDSVVKSIYKVNDKGYVVETSAVGYNNNSAIDILIGFDNDGTIIAIKTLSQQETNGYGSKCFENINIEKNYLNKTMDEDVDMVSGATLTSNAMKKMINSARDALKELD